MIKTNNLIQRFPHVIAGLIFLSSTALAAQNPPTPESEFDNPFASGGNNMVTHKVTVVPVAQWEMKDLAGTGATANSGTPSSSSSSWTNNTSGMTGQIAQQLGSGYDVFAMGEVFDNIQGQSQSVSLVPQGTHQEYWTYMGSETGDVEEGNTNEIKGYAHSKAGNSKALVWAIAAYNSTFVDSVAESNAAVASTSGIGGSTSTNWSAGGNWGNWSITGGQTTTTVISYSTGHIRENMANGLQSGFSQMQASRWGLKTKCAAKCDVFADGGETSGVGNSRAKGDLRGYVSGHVTLGEVQL